MTSTAPRKTAAEKAQEDLDAANRKVERLTERKAKLAAQHDAVLEDLAAAKVARDYIASHPALTQRDPEPVAIEVAIEPEAEPEAEQAPRAGDGETAIALDENGLVRPAAGTPPF